MPGQGRRRGAKGLQHKTEYLGDGGAMKPVLVILHNIQVRHADRIVYNGWVVGDMQEDEGLSGTHVAILDTFIDHIGE
ncbi:hypothetical protein RRF57_009323 [Xylaria bambusicola]|uniref:Uncharacterized protein n=1 Tax=Xylaria bambusicola TaxID=326684 RepID=A0AAN7UTF5_9PEZI